MFQSQIKKSSVSFQMAVIGIATLGLSWAANRAFPAPERGVPINILMAPEYESDAGNGDSGPSPSPTKCQYAPADPGLPLLEVRVGRIEESGGLKVEPGQELMVAPNSGIKRSHEAIEELHVATPTPQETGS